MDKLFKALNDPTRRAILERLREQELSAGEIAAGFTFSKPPSRIIWICSNNPA